MFLNGNSSEKEVESEVAKSDVLNDFVFISEHTEEIKNDDGTVEFEFYTPLGYLRRKDFLNTEGVLEKTIDYHEYNKETYQEPYNPDDYIEAEYIYDTSTEENIENRVIKQIIER